MAVVKIIHIMDMERLKPFFSHGPDKILRLHAHQSAMPQVQASHNPGGIQRIQQAAELLRLRTHTVHNIPALIVVLPHILRADPDAVLLAIRNQATVKCQVFLPQTLLFLRVSQVLDGVNYDISYPHNRSGIHGAQDPLFRHTVLLLRSVRRGKRRMGLAETNPVFLPQFLQTQSVLPPLIRTPDALSASHLKKAPVYGIKTRFRQNADAFLIAEYFGCLFRCCNQTHLVFS